MTMGNREQAEMQALIEYTAGRSAFRAQDAAKFLRIPVVAAARLLDELVEAGAAERLRAVGCDHSRYDHYRLHEASSGAVGSEAHLPPNRPRAGPFGTYPHPPRPVLRRTAIWRTAALSLALFITRVPASQTAEPRAGLDTLDGLVDRWMMLRTTIAEEQREWKARRKQWEEEIALLEQEAEMLKTEIDEGDTFVSSVEKKRDDMLANKQRMETELRKLRAVLDLAEADLRRWRARIPPGLMGSLESVFNALPTTQMDAEKVPLTKRAQTIAALYTQIESLQNHFHSVSETLDVDGTRRQVDVLYVGLARAFAVSPAMDWSAVGTPLDRGWTWTQSGQYATAIRLAIAALNRQETARLVSLPMQVSGEVTP